MTTPEPLVPAEVDLRDFPFTPLFRARLFGSSFHARTTDSEWRAGVTLWLKSWDQVPAGTLPDDEIDLCRLAELGRDIKTWRKVAKGALHGWVKCSDGRLHHPVVAEGVLDAWSRRSKQSKRGTAGAEAKWRKHREAMAQAAEPDGASMQNGMAQAGAGDGASTAQAMLGDGKGQGQGQGEEKASPDGEAKKLTKAFEEEFERMFWPAYPEKNGKKEGKAAFLKARKHTSIEEIMAGLHRYVEKLALPNAPKPKYAQGWLNGERWTDGAPAASNGHPPDPDETFRAMIRVYLERGTWARTHWGPAIGEPGCRVPPAIIDEFREQLGAKPPPGTVVAGKGEAA